MPKEKPGSYPAYRALYQRGELQHRAVLARQVLTACRLCGWDCGINRAVEIGPCRTGLTARAATAYIHKGEERPLSVNGGSGAIFFSNCELRCQYCQTYRWNILGQGQPVTSGDIASLMLQQQASGAANINLVTPIHVLPTILESLQIACAGGLEIPLVWNSSGYETQQCLDLLDGVIDIYLPDMKYGNNQSAKRLSAVPDYVGINRAAVLEMHRQVGHLKLDDQGTALRGVIVRHLVLPGNLPGTVAVLDWIAENLGSETYISLMDQYTPAYRAAARAGISQKLGKEEYNLARDYAISLGLTRLDNSLLFNQPE